MQHAGPLEWAYRSSVGRASSEGLGGGQRAHGRGPWARAVWARGGAPRRLRPLPIAGWCSVEGGRGAGEVKATAPQRLFAVHVE